MRIAQFLMVALLVPSIAPAQSTTLPAADRHLSLTATDVFSIGGSDAEEWAQFRNIDAVAFDSSGTLYIMERRPPRVIAVGHDGRFLRHVGGRGGGPGEYTIPAGLVVFPSGALVVHDLGKRAFVQFDPDGKPGKELRPSIPDGETGTIMSAGENRIAYGASVFIVDGMRVLSGRYDEPATSQPLGIIDVGTAAGRTVTRAWLAPFPQSRLIYDRELLSPAVSWTATSRGAIAVADTVSYRIKVFEGSTSRTITRAIPPRRPTASDREWALVQHRNRLIDPVTGRSRVAGAGAGGSDAQQVQIREIERGIAASTFANEVQVIRRLTSDWNGQLWVVRAGPDLGKTGPIDVITPTGSYVGTLTGQDLPDAFGPGGLVAYVGADANGAVVLRVKRVEIR